MMDFFLFAGLVLGVLWLSERLTNYLQRRYERTATPLQRVITAQLTEGQPR